MPSTLNAVPQQGIRPPAVAGLFYPGDREALRAEVDRLLAAARQPRIAGGIGASDVPGRPGERAAARPGQPGEGTGDRVAELAAERAAIPEPLPPALPEPLPAAPPKALLVPHAGYVYSGATAARAFAALDPIARRVRRVVLVGPAHRVAFRGLALPGAGRFATPLGAVEVDAAAVAALARFPQVTVRADAHAGEHALEVQIPFLQRLLADFTVVPLLVGDADAAAVGEVLAALWGGEETLFVISSDLSHYLDYDRARRRDRATVAALLGDGPALDHEQACGATPIEGLRWLARRRGLHGRLLDLCNSGDTAGDRRRVVGYAAVAYHG